MKYKLLTFVILLSVFISCKSYVYQNNPNKLSLFGPEIKPNNYSVKVSEYNDSKIFHLNLSIVTKDSLLEKQSIQIIKNRPMNRIDPVSGLEIIESVSSTPFYTVESDAMGKADFYFDSNDKFDLILDFGYLSIKPVMGKKLALTIYSDE